MSETYTFNGDITFGGDTGDYVLVTGGVDTGAVTPRVQDVDNPAGDQTFFGRDYLTGPTYAFTVRVQPADGDVWGAVGRLAGAWNDPSLRGTAGALMVMTVNRAGQTYTVFGRPRQFGVKPSDTETATLLGYVVVALTFKAESPLIGVGAPKSVSFGLLLPPDGGGLVLPATVPFALAAGTQDRANSLNVGGSMPAPFTVTVKGPTSGSVSGVAVKGNGWSFGITPPIAYDQTLKIDTRTQAVTINGVNTPGALTPQSRLSTARLAPGAQTVTFTGADPTATSKVTLSWYDSITS